MSITTPKGFRAGGVSAGLKPSGNPDVALVINDGPVFAGAGVFTTNRVKAAPVTWSQNAVLDGVVRAVVLNSGGANACTGPSGYDDTQTTAGHVAQLLNIEDANDVVVCSTGLIGERLPMAKLIAGVSACASQLSADDAGGAAAAQAIMTTDTVPKAAIANGTGYSVAGMAKGAGMLAPSLATMLVVLTTDADVDAITLDGALRNATSQTFDRLDSDGCMSTNDTVLLLASGASQVSPQTAEFYDAVQTVCADLARQLMADAEGASKNIAIRVLHAASESDAVEVGRAVSRSNLLKCAIHGEDPNWGRVLSAVGTTQALFDPDRIDVAINGIWVCRSGSVGEDRTKIDMSARDVEIIVDLDSGDHEATILTNDLTAAYVHENSAYST